MTEVLECVDKARDYFEINKYPSNFFDYIINTEDYIEKYNMLLFKQNIGETSGFIGYAENEIPIICINYDRNIGHQNFTLAHEIGHFYLHKGISICDTNSDVSIGTKNKLEAEANTFAAELLYPLKYVIEDYKYIRDNSLLEEKNNLNLGDFINSLCEKYCISFKFAFCRILFESEWSHKHNVRNKYNQLISDIGPISKRYKAHNHIVIKGYKFYKPYIGPLDIMKQYVNELIDNKEISPETGEAIINRNIDLEGCR
jgi:Zn-dependent peptidase ImmA (M78 family)